MPPLDLDRPPHPAGIRRGRSGPCGPLTSHRIPSTQPGTQRADLLVRGRARSGRRPDLVPDRRGRHRPDAREDARGPRRPASSTPSSSGSRRPGRSSPASTASRSGSRRPATRGSNGCSGEEDGFHRPDPHRRGRARAPDADRPTPRGGLHLPEHPPGVLWRSAPARRLARRPPARRPGPRRLPRRAPRPGPGAVERLAGSGRGALPGPPRRRAQPGPGTDGPDPRRLPADRLRPRPRSEAGVRGGGPRRRPRHLPPASPARPRRRVRPRRPQARPPSTP